MSNEIPIIISLLLLVFTGFSLDRRISRIHNRVLELERQAQQATGGGTK